jgi:hypothetical protein
MGKDIAQFFKIFHHGIPFGNLPVPVGTFGVDSLKTGALGQALAAKEG